MSSDSTEVVAVNLCVDSINQRIKTLGWDHVSAEERAVANTLAFYGSALNGGLDDIYFNSSYLGDMASELHSSLTLVGAVRAAQIFRESFGYFPQASVPTTLDLRVHVLRSCGDAPFEAWNRRLFKEAEDCYRTLHLFITSHAAIFRDPDHRA